MSAAVKGTRHEGMTSRTAMAALKRVKVGRMATGIASIQEERRWQWMTWENLNDWFDCWKKMVIEYHFAEAKVEGGGDEVPERRRRRQHAGTTTTRR